MAKGKIIVMRLFGGLGNQLFQYAFLVASRSRTAR